MASLQLRLDCAGVSLQRLCMLDRITVLSNSVGIAWRGHLVFLAEGDIRQILLWGDRVFYRISDTRYEDASAVKDFANA